MISKSARASAERDFLLTLAGQIGRFGFGPKVLGQSFRQAISTGKWEFHISFVTHRNNFDLTADVASRVDAIEDLVNQFDTKLTTAEKRKSMTIGAELGNIAMGATRRWTIYDVEDIPAICDKVTAAFQEVGLPFLQGHSDVASVHRVLTGTRTIDFVLAPVLGPRYMRAVASAYLLGHVSEVSFLSERYEADLLGTNDLYLGDFRCLARALSTRTPKFSR